MPDERLVFGDLVPVADVALAQGTFLAAVATLFAAVILTRGVISWPQRNLVLSRLRSNSVLGANVDALLHCSILINIRRRPHGPHEQPRR